MWREVKEIKYLGGGEVRGLTVKQCVLWQRVDGGKRKFSPETNTMDD